MSLCPMSWRSTKRLSRQTGQVFVHASAHHDGDVYAVDPEGGTWLVRRRGKTPISVEESDIGTTTAWHIQGKPWVRVEDEWADEIRRRIEEVST